MDLFVNCFMVFIIIFGSSFLFFQANKIYQSKSTEGVSTIAYLIYLFSSIGWLFYSFYNFDYILIFSSVLGILGSIIILLLIYKYKK
jgi:uncharacterized protein with PQ loop repeat